MYRTNSAFIMSVLIDFTQFFIGDSRVQNSEKFVVAGVNQEIIPYNKDFTDATFLYFKYLYIVLSFSRVIIILASIKYLKVTKAIAYYMLAMEFIFEVGLPINRGSESAGYVNLLMTIFFVLDYFHFWPTVICSALVSIANGVANGYLYSSEPSKINVLGIFVNVMMNFCAQVGVHIITTAAGMLFVDAEVLRLGNDGLLNDLDEGVIIVD